MRALDFRSDTVTRPSPEMRAAMASAEVGDDVLDRDPLMDRLERRVAELLGLEAGLWTPTGCMANTIALMLHLSRGDRFLAPAQAHVLGSELGTPAWLAQGMPEALPWEAGPGRITPMQVFRAAGRPGPYYTLRSALLCLENTHNFAGGTCTTAAEHRALVEQARALGLKVHLDGARLWHAAAATGDTLADLAWGADTVNVCLSKGLGAPMGSVLCGSRDLVEAGRRIRKMLGGGVRQGGIVAAAGLVALDYLPRVPEDHAKARRLADGLRAMGFRVAPPDTNILLVPVPDAAAALSILEGVGVRVLPVGSALRFITHRDLADADIEEALDRIRAAADRLVTTWEGDRPMV
ncbi:threonine aldolase family protein [Mesoterricola sediminis]|uniref:Threonine aldolase n=1 Tax=Mesoterricola sediminis TaxID=2927980 RepID=A0AA48GSQ0_9BACT|nr:GntG family PLP-dependent aldolase [Mesoterricola sediminis]BDU76887.1 threonine aldolase [Mesoterricola sediminis]